MVTEVKCPHCSKKVAWNKESVWRPFCSQRCKMVDLGDWFAENHRLSTEDESDESVAVIHDLDNE